MAKTNYKVLHTLVGPFPKGRVISLDDLKAIGGKDFTPDAHLKKGALEETDEDLTPGPTPVGPLTVGKLHPENAGLRPPDGGRAANREDSGSYGIEPGKADEELDSMKKAELLELAQNEGAEVRDDMTKAELIAEIRAHREATATGTEE